MSRCATTTGVTSQTNREGVNSLMSKTVPSVGIFSVFFKSLHNFLNRLGRMHAIKVQLRGRSASPLKRMGHVDLGRYPPPNNFPSARNRCQWLRQKGSEKVLALVCRLPPPPSKRKVRKMALLTKNLFPAECRNTPSRACFADDRGCLCRW